MKKEPSPDAHWRDSARASRLFIFNSTAAFPLLFFMFHIRLWTFFLAVGTMLFLTAITHYGFTITVFFRWLRSLLAGPRKMAKPWWT